MDAVEYLRQRERLCETQQALRRVMNLDANEKELCDGCPLAIYHDHFCGILENSDPDLAVSIVEQWAEAQRSDGVYLSAMDERFVRIYIGKGYLLELKEAATIVAYELFIQDWKDELAARAGAVATPQ